MRLPVAGLGMLLALGAMLPAQAAMAQAASAPSTQDEGQRRPMDVPDPLMQQERGRTRLILKDGSYQIVLRYEIDGNVVRYVSAERNGAVEDVPLALVDLAATVRWHDQNAAGTDGGTPVLSPELAREEAARAALTLEVKPDLRLPDQGSVLVLDTFENTPELVPVPQEGSDLNKETAHAVQKKAIHPLSSPHEIVEVPGARSEIQLHVPDPVFYVRIGTDEMDPSGGNAITVAVHGEGGDTERDAPSGGAESSDYVIERVDSRQDLRVVDSFRIALLGTNRRQPDVYELREEPQPGGRWLRLTPEQPLPFGEYALVEVLSTNTVNLDVWDFGVHPDAPENFEAIRPEPREPVVLKNRP
jgi:hypothetical protein